MTDIAQDKKVVIALRHKLDAGPAMNAACHLALSLCAAAYRTGADQEGGDLDDLRASFIDFPDADGNSHSPVSALSLVVLKARPSHLRALREGGVEDPDITVVDFTSDMTGGTYIEQLDRMRQRPEGVLEYWGIGAFGPAASLDELTHKFSLWG